VYGPIGPVVKVDPTEWFDAIRVNLFGSFLVARRAAQVMIERGGGGVIVLMSGGGAATPFPNYTSYACGKVGVVRLTETLAQELVSHNVRVNCVAPGFVATRLHDQTLAAGVELAGAFLENTKAQLAKGGVPPSVAAGAVAFLLSDRAAGITGRFVAAPYDGFENWPTHAAAIKGSDLFTLRRIVPRDRGMDWQ
jgi:NAD(P)-dependent dehydrogenase (short-subunit alcohol dehydrogenase family)